MYVCKIIMVKPKLYISLAIKGYIYISQQPALTRKIRVTIHTQVSWIIGGRLNHEHNIPLFEGHNFCGFYRLT